MRDCSEHLDLGTKKFDFTIAQMRKYVLLY